MGKARLTREAVLKAPDIVEKEIEVPEWGGTVLIRTLTKAQAIELRKQATVNDKIDLDRFEILIFVHAVIEPKFMPEDYEALKAKSASAMDRVLMEVYRGSGMTKEEVAQIERAFPGGPSEVRS